MDADPGLAVAMILHGDLISDVNGAAAADDCLARASAAQLALHPDLVVHAKLQLELLTCGDRLELGFTDELAVVKHSRRPWQEQQLGTVGNGRPQIGLSREHWDGEVVERGVEFEPGDSSLVRAAVRRHCQRPGYPVHQAGPCVAYLGG